MTGTRSFDRVYFSLRYPAKEVLTTEGKNKGKKKIERKIVRFDSFPEAEAAFNALQKTTPGGKVIQVTSHETLEQVLPAAEVVTLRPEREEREYMPREREMVRTAGGGLRFVSNR